MLADVLLEENLVYSLMYDVATVYENILVFHTLIRTYIYIGIQFYICMVIDNVADTQNTVQCMYVYKNKTPPMTD